MSTTLSEDGLASPDMLSFTERLEIIFAAEAAILSGISIVVLIIYKLYHAILRAHRWNAAGLQQPEDVCDSSLFMVLILGESLRVTGKIMTLKWAKDAFITAPSTLCYTQGMVQLIGTNLIDWSTFAITVHTFAVLVLQWNAPKHIVKYLAGGVLAVVALIVGITVGVRGIGIVGPTGLWCWITADHKLERLLGEYLWMWAILALTIVFYTIDFLVIRGHVVLEGGFRLRWVSRDRVRLELAEADDADEPEARKMATQLLFYPIIYLICVLPFSITRWMSFSGHYVPNQASAFTTCLFSLSGFLNVLLFFKTRPQLIKGGPLPAIPNQDHKHEPQDSRNRGDDLPLDERQTTHRATVSGGAHQGIMNGNSEGSDGSGFLSTGRRDGGGGMLQQSASSSSQVISTHRQASHYDEDDDDDRDGQGYLPP